MASHMRGQVPQESSSKHGAGWMLLYLLAAAVVAGLVWLLFGMGA